MVESLLMLSKHLLKMGQEVAMQTVCYSFRNFFDSVLF